MIPLSVRNVQLILSKLAGAIINPFASDESDIEHRKFVFIPHTLAQKKLSSADSIHWKNSLKAFFSVVSFVFARPTAKKSFSSSFAKLIEFAFRSVFCSLFPFQLQFKVCLFHVENILRSRNISRDSCARC